MRKLDVVSIEGQELTWPSSGLEASEGRSISVDGATWTARWRACNEDETTSAPEMEPHTTTESDARLLVVTSKIKANIKALGLRSDRDIVHAGSTCLDNVLKTAGARDSRNTVRLCDL